MPRQQLQETLQKLSDALREESELDDETRRQLNETMDDIRQLLNDQPEDEKEQSSLSEKIVDRLREFEIEHPIIGGLIQRLSDGLANLGI